MTSIIIKYPMPQAAYVRSLQFKWNHIQRLIPTMFFPFQYAIDFIFYPALFGGYLSFFPPNSFGKLGCSQLCVFCFLGTPSSQQGASLLVDSIIKREVIDHVASASRNCEDQFNLSIT